MTQAHTPGPWVHDENCAGRILGPDGVAVCAVYGSMARAQEDDCNQRLIAAAPELLEVIEECLKRGWMWDNDPHLYTVASKVARKARGVDHAG